MKRVLFLGGLALLLMSNLSCDQIIEEMLENSREHSQEKAEAKYFYDHYSGSYVGGFSAGEMNWGLQITIDPLTGINARISNGTITEELDIMRVEAEGIYATSRKLQLILSGSMETKSGTFSQPSWSGSWAVQKR